MEAPFGFSSCTFSTPKLLFSTLNVESIMPIRIDVLDVGQRDRFVEQLLVERQRETPIQHVIVEHRNAENAPDKVKLTTLPPSPPLTRIGIDLQRVVIVPAVLEQPVLHLQPAVAGLGLQQLQLLPERPYLADQIAPVLGQQIGTVHQALRQIGNVVGHMFVTPAPEPFTITTHCCPPPPPPLVAFVPDRAGGASIESVPMAFVIPDTCCGSLERREKWSQY
uniref:Uncharacterized protein n=1 Tax=Anopheles coluzzii TaxID=1518534 RepID=A0A8W7PVX9_ANOCL